MTHHEGLAGKKKFRQKVRKLCYRGHKRIPLSIHTREDQLLLGMGIVALCFQSPGFSEERVS